MTMNEEERKMRDNIALVAMQCLLNRKKQYSLWQRILMFFKGIEYQDDPQEISEEAYYIAQSMMEERYKVNKCEEAM